mmetsp:Transcript_35697/g.76208  ORF Transcript_35697/g.76208 Transcript_35697/m.76208 type:complete len:223 (-) Transcript_35697:330-998(-)
MEERPASELVSPPAPARAPAFRIACKCDLRTGMVSPPDMPGVMLLTTSRLAFIPPPSKPQPSPLPPLSPPPFMLPRVPVGEPKIPPLPPSRTPPSPPPPSPPPSPWPAPPPSPPPSPIPLTPPPAASRSIPRARRSVVGRHLLYEGKELAVEGDDNALFALLACSGAHVAVEVDGAHDAVAALFVDEALNRLAVVGHRLVGAVDVGLLEDGGVPRAHREVGD